MFILLQDIRFAGRMLLKSPGFAAVTVITLALGIGANTAVFSIAHRVAFRPLAYAEPEKLVSFAGFDRPRGFENIGVALPDTIDCREQCSAFSDLGAYRQAGLTYSTGERAERVSAIYASSDFLPMLGFDAALGRVFGPEDDRAGVGLVAVVSDRFWRQKLLADPDVLGRDIVIDAKPCTVVGVLPTSIEHSFQRGIDVWLPLAHHPSEPRRGSFAFRAIARLRPEVDLRTAQAEVDCVYAGIAETYPRSHTGRGATLVPIKDLRLTGRDRATLAGLAGIAAIVLLIACSNVATLLLTRARGREMESAVRRALGAGPWRIVRQSLTECAVLALIGGVLALIVAQWGVVVLRSAIPSASSQATELTFDWQVLLFTFLLSMTAVLLCGLAPIVTAARLSLSLLLRAGAGSMSAGRRHTLARDCLLVGQVTMAMAMMIGAGFMIRSIVALTRVDAGFDSRGLMTMRVTLSGDDSGGRPGLGSYADERRMVDFFDRAVESIAALPQVASACAVSEMPLTGRFNDLGATIEDAEPLPGGDLPHLGRTVVTRGYFQCLGIPILSGRDFSRDDTAEGPPVVIVSRSVADRFWPGEDPIGRRIKYGRRENDEPWLTVIGVVGDVHAWGLTEDVTLDTYRPNAQAGWASAMTYVARSRGDPEVLAGPMQEAIWSIDPNLALYSISTMDRHISDRVGDRSVVTLLLSVFAGLAMLLAVVGLAGSVSNMASCRRKEIGLRVALGARPFSVIRLMMNRAITITLVGVGLGCGVALMLGPTLEHLTFDVSVSDGPTFIGVSVLLVSVALASSYLSARPIAKADPMASLRCE